jgi:oligopeptide transport system substrate-binding protein
MRIHRCPPTAAHPMSGAALLLLTILILLSGCAPAWPFPHPTPTATVRLRLPDSQQIFQVLEANQIADFAATLDPASYLVDAEIARLIFPQLVTLDEQQRPVDWAAERHEVSSDGLIYTFHVRPGMTWSDGSPIDANTFIYSINRALDPCTYLTTAYVLYPIRGAEEFNRGSCPAGAIKSGTTLIGSSLRAPDALTLQITLERPAGYFLTALAAPTSWGVPQALVERYTIAEPDPYQAQQAPTHSTWTYHLLDTGAFSGNLYMLTSWQRQEETNGRTIPATPSLVIPVDEAARFTLRRNERFWGQQPLLNEIRYTAYKDAGGAWAAYEDGAGDVGFPYDSAQQLEEARHLKDSTLQQIPAPVLAFLSLNPKLPPFDDVRVRNAFSLALDRQAIAHDVFRDLWQPTIHLIPEGMPGYTPDLKDASGRQGKDALTPDLTTARRLAAAYAKDKCGGDFAQCPQLDFVHFCSVADRISQLRKRRTRH